MVTDRQTDPTAGRTARALREDKIPAAVTDPTAGRRARALRVDPATPAPLTDPTDPRYGAIPGPEDTAA
jgi:hypothetical protein